MLGGRTFHWKQRPEDSRDNFAHKAAVGSVQCHGLCRHGAQATDYADTERKQALLREMFGSMGKGVHVDIDFHCEYGKHIFIGDKVIINMNCTFVDNNRIDIGSNVLIASNVQIYTATHSTKVSERMVEDWAEGEEICRTYALPVRIEDGVWIGGGAILLPGVTIGKNSVIGAGSVVTRAWRWAILAV